MVKLDIEYTQRRSFWLDIEIIFKTVPALWRQYCDVHPAKTPQRAQPVTDVIESFS